MGTDTSSSRKLVLQSRKNTEVALYIYIFLTILHYPPPKPYITYGDLA